MANAARRAELWHHARVPESKVDIESLTPQERLLLIERLWQSLDAGDVPLTTAQMAELDRRLADIERRPHDQMSWADAKRRITGRPD